MKSIGEFIDSIPKPIRDFAEGAVAVAVAAAIAAVLGLNLNDPSLTPKQIAFAAAIAAISAIIAYARRAITPPTP